MVAARTAELLQEREAEAKAAEAEYRKLELQRQAPPCRPPHCSPWVQAFFDIFIITSFHL